MFPTRAGAWVPVPDMNRLRTDRLDRLRMEDTTDQDESRTKQWKREDSQQKPAHLFQIVEYDSYGCWFVNKIDLDCDLFFERLLQGKERRRTGACVRLQQGERFFPQTVYAHIRGLGPVLGAQGLPTFS